jgi:hypothetical protein
MPATDDAVLRAPSLALKAAAATGADVEALPGAVAVAVAAALQTAARVLDCLVAPGSLAHCGVSAIAAAVAVVAKAMSYLLRCDRGRGNAKTIEERTRGGVRRRKRMAVVMMHGARARESNIREAGGTTQLAVACTHVSISLSLSRAGRSYSDRVSEFDGQGKLLRLPLPLRAFLE